MTKLNNETRELNIEDLDTVSGGIAFYGMGCSANQSAGIGRIVNALGGGGSFLGGIATYLGRLYCN
jgi:hypothetical protein